MTYSSEPALNTVGNSRSAWADGPVGIGGWLILPIIGLCGTIVLTLINLYGVVAEWDGIKAIIGGGNDALVALRLPVAISLLSGLGTVVFATICLQRIFTYSPAVPKLMTIFYLGLIAATLGEILADSLIASATGSAMDPGNFKEIARVCISAAIWIPYFHRSRRVANTFRARERQVDKKISEIF